MPTLIVPIPGAAYPYVIERGVLAALGERVRAVVPHERALLVMDEAIAETHGRAARQALTAAGYAVSSIAITAEESRKTLETARSLYDAMIRAMVDRSTPVIALGGGIIGDTAGFVAATFMRGLPLVQVPTTLLAMVDAAIGGKTGVNLPGPDGHLVKNMIGAFHQPRMVIADPNVLATLPPRHLRAGLAESVKHGVLADPELLSLLAEESEHLAGGDAAVLERLITHSARIKIDIVAADEREAGDRMVLNLGHTFAHAIEPIPELDLLHGEAVAIGLVAACECAVVTGRLHEDRLELVRDLLTVLGLPTRLPRAASAALLIERMGYDKKNERGRRRLILPVEIGEVEITDDVPVAAVVQAWVRVGAEP